MPRDALRNSHVGIRLNDESAKMEVRLGVALGLVEAKIKLDFGLTAVIEKRHFLSRLVGDLNERLEEQLHMAFETAYRGNPTWIEPDGGLTYIEEWGDHTHCVLIAEAKRQGTNKARMAAGHPKQSKGNAIERLGKNMRGFDAMFGGESITPFVCFGEGDDFAADSSIIDRVATLNGFFPLNTVFVAKQAAEHDVLKPTSMFFREESWTPQEMAEVMSEVVAVSIPYYRDRYDLP